MKEQPEAGGADDDIKAAAAAPAETNRFDTGNLQVISINQRSADEAASRGRDQPLNRWTDEQTEADEQI